MTLTWRLPRRLVATARLAPARLVPACLLLAACHPGARTASTTTPPAPFTDTTAAEAGYVSPPQIIKADVSDAGVVILKGTAGPDAKIQLQSPEGESQATTARRSGSWVLRVPAVARPRMFALSEVITGGRVIHAEGALILLPRPAPAALLARAGFGSLILQHAGAGPSLTTIDYDPGGFAAFSGTAKPGATVRLSLDGAPAGLAQADAMGRYAVLAANHRLAFAPHLAVIETDAGSVQRAFQLIQPDPLTSIYQTSAAPDGWRVEWAASGGGVQTTLVLAAPPA